MTSTIRSTVAFAAIRLAAIALVPFLVQTLSARAVMAEPDAPADAARDERALEITRRMSAALSEAASFRVAADIAYDAVQADGQSIEFGMTGTYSIRRPDRARMEVHDRGGATRVLAYDGARLLLLDEAHGVYAAATHEGDLESMLVFAREELHLPTPLGEFLSRDLYDLLVGYDEVYWVDEQSVGGALCDHLAFRDAPTGMQIWVPREGEPLPRRIVIDYHRARGRPRFRAELAEWDLGVKLDDSLFEPTPDADAEQILFNTSSGMIPAAPATSAAPEKEGAR